jgi:nucleotide-binding universal stress UspA family protein
METSEGADMFQKVVVSTETVSACDATVSVAAELSDLHQSKLHILHVLESSSPVYRNYVKHFRTGQEIVRDAAYEEMVGSELSKNCAKDLKSVLSYEIRVVPGFPWEETLRWAREIQADLIVLGPHRLAAESQAEKRVSGSIGSTVEGVIRRARCPVMIVSGFIPRHRLEFAKIMVSTDFSKSCEHALRYAVKLAQRCASSLFLFHMVSPEQAAQLKRAEERLKAFGEAIPPEIPWEFGLEAGNRPHLAIMEYAGEKDVDIILMGSHTKEKAEKWYVGSAVESVSAMAACPVMVVSDPRSVQKMAS